MRRSKSSLVKQTPDPSPPKLAKKYDCEVCDWHAAIIEGAPKYDLIRYTLMVQQHKASQEHIQKTFNSLNADFSPVDKSFLERKPR